MYAMKCSPVHFQGSLYLDSEVKQKDSQTFVSYGNIEKYPCTQGNREIAYKNINNEMRSSLRTFFKPMEHMVTADGAYE